MELVMPFLPRKNHVGCMKVAGETPVAHLELLSWSSSGDATENIVLLTTPAFQFIHKTCASPHRYQRLLRIKISNTFDNYSPV
jgi:hypothetical protein